VEGLEPPCLTAPDPKSGTSTNFATPAIGAANVREKAGMNVEHMNKECRIQKLKTPGELLLVFGKLELSFEP
jgi:hypothetical protein